MTSRLRTGAAARIEKLVKEPTKRAVVEHELSVLEQKHGHVTPEVVVQAAFSVKSPLHAYFEWDDSVAGTKYRLEQARQLIMTVRVVSEMKDKKTSVRALVPLYDRSRRFFSREAVLTDTDEREVQLARARGELRAWVRRWIDLPELEKIRKALKSHLY